MPIKIIEEILNQRDVRIFDYVEDENGKKVPVLNKKETAIAHILYGRNTLLAHVVGAGKTFEMVAAAQESKQR